jgi:hypothetical protein
MELSRIIVVGSFRILFDNMANVLVLNAGSGSQKAALYTIEPK